MVCPILAKLWMLVVYVEETIQPVLDVMVCLILAWFMMSVVFVVEMDRAVLCPTIAKAFLHALRAIRSLAPVRNDIVFGAIPLIHVLMHHK